MAVRRCRILTTTEAEQLANLPRLVGYRPDGMCGRLICFLNVVRLAAVFGTEPKYVWESGAVGGNQVHGYEAALPLAPDDRIEVRHSSTLDREPPWANIRFDVPVALPGEPPDAVYSDLGRIARDLRLADGRTIAESYRPGKYAVSLHARQGDAHRFKWLGTKYYPASLWRLGVTAAVKNSRSEPSSVYLATDSPELTVWAMREHGDAVRTSADLPNSSVRKVDLDMADALELASGSVLVASPGSAFSTFAALLAGTEHSSPAEYVGFDDVFREMRDMAFTSYADDVGRLIHSLEAAGLGDQASGRMRADVRVMAWQLGRPRPEFSHDPGTGEPLNAESRVLRRIAGELGRRITGRT